METCEALFTIAGDRVLAGGNGHADRQSSLPAWSRGKGQNSDGNGTGRVMYEFQDNQLIATATDEVIIAADALIEDATVERKAMVVALVTGSCGSRGL